MPTSRTSLDTISLNFAGYAFTLQREPGAAPLNLPPVYDGFQTSDTSVPEVAHFKILPADPVLLPRVSPQNIVWQSEHWCLAACDIPWHGQAGREQSYVLAVNALPDERRLSVAHIAPDFSAGRLVPVAGRNGTVSQFSFNYPGDQVVVLNRLLQYGVGVVHSGAVAFEGQGIIFCGKSGAGKTTLSRLCRDNGAQLLNDDRQFIRPMDGRIMLTPTPWHGLEVSVDATTVPLRAILHLVQAPKNRIIPIEGAEAAARLMGNTVAPFYFKKPMETVLELWDRVIAQVPSYIMEFTRDKSTVDLIRQVLRG